MEVLEIEDLEVLVLVLLLLESVLLEGDGPQVQVDDCDQAEEHGQRELPVDGQSHDSEGPDEVEVLCYEDYPHSGLLLLASVQLFSLSIRFCLQVLVELARGRRFIDNRVLV